MSGPSTFRGVPEHTPGARLQTSASGGVISSPDRESPVALNPLALALWDLCDGATRVQEMEDAIAHLFRTDLETVRSAVRRCLDDLSALGLLQWVPEPGR